MTVEENAVLSMLAKTRQLLEWMPVCSEGSSGYQNRMAVEDAMNKLEDVFCVRPLW